MSVQTVQLHLTFIMLSSAPLMSFVMGHERNLLAKCFPSPASLLQTLCCQVGRKGWPNILFCLVVSYNNKEACFTYFKYIKCIRHFFFFLAANSGCHFIILRPCQVSSFLEIKICASDQSHSCCPNPAATMWEHRRMVQQLTATLACSCTRMTSIHQIMKTWCVRARAHILSTVCTEPINWSRVQWSHSR